ncbi:hypothetical protein HYX09_05495 [Candidatus Woesearchaeota archaeon]|nr:hypothetical protein [Candidatus Woesearchaeota archaeon]
MKYPVHEFNDAAAKYMKLLGSLKGKDILVILDIDDADAFYSIAPLSMAVHEQQGDMCVLCFSKKSEAFDAMNEVWDLNDSLKEGLSDAKTEALRAFMEAAEKKCSGKFAGIFRRPDMVLKAGKGFFEGEIELPINSKWHKEYRLKELQETAKVLWKDVYNIKKNERIGVGFCLIPGKEMLKGSLEDYLDSYLISRAMMEACNKGNVFVSASTQRQSMLEDPERVSELRATLLGCELEKDIDEDVFRKYRQLSKLLRLDRIKPVDATFFVSSKGYPGRHLFGERIGYPTLNRKSRWQSPGQILYKLDFYSQSKSEERDPMARVGFTETIPIDIFIETNLVDWDDIRRRNQNIKDILDRCDKVFVKGKVMGKHVTRLEVNLVKPDGTRRWVRRSDTDVREKINKEYLKMTGIKAGNMANIPGGEAFLTPESIRGKFVGDVVIHVDQSYVLNPKNPIVVECYGDSYKIIAGPEGIIKKLNERKDEAMKLLLESEKHKSIPQEIIDIKKKNFQRIGEFAINTNPKARLCEYLIVNEKIARMMHIALGSGFEPDRDSIYHMDIVFNAPRQMLDVYGIDSKGDEHWILKEGEFAVKIM